MEADGFEGFCRRLRLKDVFDSLDDLNSSLMREIFYRSSNLTYRKNNTFVYYQAEKQTLRIT